MMNEYGIVLRHDQEETKKESYEIKRWFDQHFPRTLYEGVVICLLKDDNMKIMDINEEIIENKNINISLSQRVEKIKKEMEDKMIEANKEIGILKKKSVSLSNKIWSRKKTSFGE